MACSYSPAMPPEEYNSASYMDQEMTDAPPSWSGAQLLASPLAKGPRHVHGYSQFDAQASPRQCAQEHARQPSSVSPVSNPQVPHVPAPRSNTGYMRSPSQPHQIPAPDQGFRSILFPTPDVLSGQQAIATLGSHGSAHLYPLVRPMPQLPYMHHDVAHSAPDAQAGGMGYPAHEGLYHEHALEHTGVPRKQLRDNERARSHALSQQPQSLESSGSPITSSTPPSLALQQTGRATISPLGVPAYAHHAHMSPSPKTAQQSRHDSLDPASPPTTQLPMQQASRPSVRSPLLPVEQVKQPQLRPFTGAGHRPIALAATHPSQYRSASAQMAPPAAPASASSAKPVRLIPVTRPSLPAAPQQTRPPKTPQRHSTEPSSQASSAMQSVFPTIVSPKKHSPLNTSTTVYATPYADPMHHTSTSPRKAQRNLVGRGPEKDLLEPGNAISPTVMVALPFGDMTELATRYTDDRDERRAGARIGGNGGR